jgi:maltose alpha-D-glucosyltransferase/alpha-amylase
MQWANASNAGFSTAPQPYAPAIDDEVFGYHQVNVQAQRADPASLWHALKRLIAIRKMYPTLSDSECHFLTGLPKAILAFTRGPQADPQFLVLHNLSAESQTVALPAFSNERWRDVLADRIWDKPTSFALAPYQSLWLKREV